MRVANRLFKKSISSNFSVNMTHYGRTIFFSHRNTQTVNSITATTTAQKHRNFDFPIREHDYIFFTTAPHR